MKKRIVKKYLKKKIDFGWRAYLSLNIPYEWLNLKSENFMSIQSIEEALELKWTGEESGFVDHFNFTEPDDTEIKVNLSLHHTSYEFRPEFKNQLTYTDDEGVTYSLVGYRGIVNPKYTDDNDEEYWMPNSFWRWTLTDNDAEKGIPLLKKYANNIKLLESLFSGNWLFGLFTGKDSNDIEQDLKRELAELSEVCKTIYLDYHKDYFTLTYAIRYYKDANKFVNNLTDIVLKHKLDYKKL